MDMKGWRMSTFPLIFLLLSPSHRMKGIKHLFTKGKDERNLEGKLSWSLRKSRKQAMGMKARDLKKDRVIHPQHKFSFPSNALHALHCHYISFFLLQLSSGNAKFPETRLSVSCHLTDASTHRAKILNKRESISAEMGIRRWEEELFTTHWDCRLQIATTDYTLQTANCSRLHYEVLRNLTMSRESDERKATQTEECEWDSCWFFLSNEEYKRWHDLCHLEFSTLCKNWSMGRIKRIKVERETRSVFYAPVVFPLIVIKPERLKCELTHSLSFVRVTRQN